MITRHLSCFVVVLSCSNLAHAAADDGSGAKDSDVRSVPATTDKLDKVQVIGTRRDDTALRQQQTAAKTIIGPEELQKYGDSTIADVLKRQPGITLGGNPGRGGDIRMRGLGSGYTQILLNGERPPAGFSLDTLSPSMIDRIEIMRGPVAEHSSNAIAGTINIILKVDSIKRPSEFKVTLGSDHGRLQPSLFAQTNGKSERLAWSLSGFVSGYNQSSDSADSLVWLGREGQPQRTENSAATSSYSGVVAGLNPRLTWTWENGDTLSIQPFFFHRDGSTRGNTLSTYVPVQARDVVNTDYSASSRNDSLRTLANWKGSVGEGNRLELKLGMNINDSHSDSVTRRSARDSAFDTVRQDTGSVRSTGFTTGGKFTYPLADKQTLATGFESEMNWRRETTHTLINGVDPLAEFGPDSKVRTSRLAVYAQDEKDFGKSFSGYVGVRWEGIETRSLAVVNRASVLSPMLHGVWRLGDDRRDLIRASITRSYRAPATSDLIARPSLSIDNTPTNPDTTGNPQLKPELSWGLDTAYEHYLEQGGVLSASVFGRTIDHLMRRRTDLVDGRWVSRPVNLDHATTFGVELEAKLRLADLLGKADAAPLDIRANLSRYWSHVSGIPGPDNRLNEQVRLTANLGLDYRFSRLPLTVGGNMNWTPSYALQSSEEQARRMGSKRVLDLYGLWKFSPVTQVRISAGNVLGADYRTTNEYVSGATHQVTQSVASTYPSLTASFEHKF